MSETIIGKSQNTQGVWFRTNIEVENGRLVATTYSTVKGQPKVFSLGFAIEPIIRFVEQYHDRLHGKVAGEEDCVGCGCVGADCGDEEVGARKRMAKKLIRSKVARGVMKKLRQHARQVTTPSVGSQSAFPATPGALAAYRAAKKLLEKSDGKATVGVLPLIPVAMALAASPKVRRAVKTGVKKLAKYGKKAFSKAFGKLLSKARQKGVLKKHGQKALKAVRAMAMKVAEKKVQRVLAKAPVLRQALSTPEAQGLATSMLGAGSAIHEIWEKTKLSGPEGIKARKAAAILRLVAEHENHQETLRRHVGASVGAAPQIVGCIGCGEQY
jgi:hypothetical protein